MTKRDGRLITKVCPVCHETFTTNKPRKKYCNYSCTTRSKLKPKKIKVCPTCDSEFQPRHQGRKYCSDRCRDNHYNLNAEKYRYHAKRRYTIFKRDSFKCGYCGASPLDKITTLEIDHIFPVSKGGKKTADNIITACRECNATKSDEPLLKNIEVEYLSEISRRNRKYDIPDDFYISDSRSTHPHCDI